MSIAKDIKDSRPRFEVRGFYNELDAGMVEIFPRSRLVEIFKLQHFSNGKCVNFGGADAINGGICGLLHDLSLLDGVDTIFADATHIAFHFTPAADIPRLIDRAEELINIYITTRGFYSDGEEGASHDA